MIFSNLSKSPIKWLTSCFSKRKCHRLSQLLLCFIFLASGPSYAEALKPPSGQQHHITIQDPSSALPAPSPRDRGEGNIDKGSYLEDEKLTHDFLPTDAKHASWVFSGVVSNETGENYGYFFRMQRDADQFHSIAALFDGQTKKVILLEESDAVIHDSLPYNWHVGRSFMRFNPINDSWIFGLQTHDNKGFNFKVDLLKQTESIPPVQSLRQGVDLLVNQTSHLNGHLEAGNDSKEQFVTAKNAWFRQVRSSTAQDKSHPFSAVLCRFNDGSGFYSVNMIEPDTLRGAVAGWCDGQGVSARMSQFINVKQSPDGPWHIRVASPQLHLVLSDFIEQHAVVAGFIAEGGTPGFCMLSNEVT